MGKTGEKLYEREPVVADALRALERLRAGRGSMLLIEGPAGTGKTSLLGSVTTRASDLGVAVLEGRGHELESSHPWGLCRSLLAGAWATQDRTPEVSLCEPVFNPSWTTPDPDATQRIAFGLGEMVDATGAATGVVIAVDDAHLADPPSLGVLEALADRLESRPIFVLLTARTGGPAQPQARRILRRLRQRSLVDAHRIGGLSRGSVSALVRDRIPGASDELCRSITDATAGNPLFCHSLLDAAEVGAEPPSPEMLLGPLGDGGEDRALRLRFFPRDSRESDFASALATIENAATIDIVAELAELDEDAAAGCAESLAAAGLVTLDGPRLRFRHPLMRDLVYGDLEETDRRRLHRSASTALWQRGARSAEVATHLLAGAPPPGDWPARVLARAASEAIAQGAPERAVECLRLAVSVVGDERERSRLMLDLALAEAAIGAEESTERLQLALAATSPGKVGVETAVKAGEALYAIGRLPEAADAFEVGLRLEADASEDLSSLTEARLIAGLRTTGMLVGNARPSLQNRFEALLEESSGQPGLAQRVALATEAGDRAMSGTGTVDSVRALARRALSGDAVPDVLGRVVLEPALAALLWSDCVAEASAHLEKLTSAARTRGDLTATVGLLPMLSFCRLTTGPLDEAERLARAALALTTDIAPGSVATSASARWLICEACLLRGDLDGARLAVSAPEVVAEGISPLAAYTLVARGRVAQAGGDHETAVTAFLGAGDLLCEAGAEGVILPWRSAAAVSCHGLGRTAQAAALLEDELCRATRFGATRAVARALRARAVIEGTSEATETLLLAAATLGDGEARVDRAITCLDLGSALRRGGRLRSSREWLREGIRQAREARAGRVEARGTEELALAGARRAGGPPTGPDALTPAQRRVATLAARGRSNLEIADRLSVSRRTVETHLTETYRRLGIESRQELSEALRGAGG